ncbi:MAG: glucan biosynthesis protein [Planctomycetes bacterium]|nr:glucan biosynthesis protein [Planctomycetota bacterium]
MQPEPRHAVGRPRVWLAIVLIAVTMAAKPVVARGSEDEPDAGPVVAFSFDDVDALARSAAAAPYSPAAAVPEIFQTASDDLLRDLRYAPPRSELWGDAPAPLQLVLRLPRPLLNQTVSINLVGPDNVRTLRFLPESLVGGNAEFVDKVIRAAPGFAGFSVGHPESARAIGSFFASLFSFAGRNSRMASFSRPAVIDIASGNGESVATFREYWLVPPQGDDDRFTVYALMDSPAMTGAFSFIVQPGTSTVVDVHAVLHRRTAAAEPAMIGVAPLVSMFLFSETAKDANDYRPEVHNADGLLVSNSETDWQWIPLSNPKRLTLSALPGAAPKGFGLIQRDANFDHYQDFRTAYEESSSVWVEPVGEWGPGRLELMEIPSTREIHSNILAYWVPDRIAAAATASVATSAEPAAIAFDYRLYWSPAGIQMHRYGAVQGTRLERNGDDNTLTFYIDFEGTDLNLLPGDTGLTSVVELPKEITLVDKQLVKNRVTGGWRLVVKVALPRPGVLDGILTARSGPPELWLAAYLKQGENLPEALTETWRYRVIP